MTAPSAWQVISNQPAPEPIPHDDRATATWGFEPTPRISSYITALVAGPYEVTRSELTSSSGRVIPLGVFARRSLWDHVDADYIFDKTRQGFAYYEEKFGVEYPFAKYDQMFVPEFNAGAMENAGAVTFTESYVFRSKVSDAVRERRVVTILHELAHMWFGDLVTMTWWNDLWLNESFAEWASTIATAEATEWEGAWTTFNAMEKTWAYRQDQLPSTHPVVAEIGDLENVQVNFDGITYAKGGSVLKQLAAYVGIDAFFAGVGAYFRKHAFGNTTLRDLLVELEETSGRDLSAWSAKWLETAGVNTLSPIVEADVDGAITRFAVMQTAPADYPTIRPHRLGIGFYDLDRGSLVRTHYAEIDVRRRCHERRRAEGPSPPRTRAAQRRGSRLCEDPARRRQSRHRDRAPLRHRGPPRPLARLGRGMGSGARRWRLRPASTSISCCATSPPRASRRRSAPRSRSCSSRRTPTWHPSRASRRAAGSRTASGCCSGRQRQAATCSCSSRPLSPAPRRTATTGRR